MLDWREMESERRRVHPEIRGVRWRKSDLDYLPITERGPLPRRLIAGLKKERDANWQLPDHILRGKLMDGFVYWERDAS